MNLSKIVIIYFLFLLYSQPLFAHGNETHDSIENPVVENETTNQAMLYEKINALYVQNVRAVFDKKCLDCHGTKKMPWYYSFPVVKQIIDSDVAEAKKHLDMTNDFPFKGHGNVKDDLKSIKDVVDKNSMPPWQYQMLHWSSSLSSEEKEKVNGWVENALKILSSD